MTDRIALRWLCLFSTIYVSTSTSSFSASDDILRGIHTPIRNKDVVNGIQQVQFDKHGQSFFEKTGFRATRDAETPRDLIVGGSVVTSQVYGSFAVTDPNQSNGLCGSTLVHPDILVSAAHCGAADIFAEGTLLNIGSLSIYGEDAIDRIEVVNQLIHPSYNEDTLEYDVMLIQISSPSSAPLSQWNSDPSVPLADESLTLVGFGRTERGTASAVLREATVNVVDTETCDAAYQLLINGERTLCAGSDLSSACSGDSGGPLFRNGMLVGIVSFGIINESDGSCLTGSDLPNGYTRVSAVSSFISEGICSLSANPPTYCFADPIPPVPAPVPTPAPVPAPTNPPTQRPPIRVPVTVPPTFPPRTFTLFPVPVAPIPLPPIFSLLAPANPTMNMASMSPSVTPSISPTAQESLSPSSHPSGIPSLDVSESPTMDQSFVPSDVPTFGQYASSNVPSNSPQGIEDVANSNEDGINITTITLPRPKSDATNGISNTSISDEKNRTTTSKGENLRFGYSSAFGFGLFLYSMFAVMI